MSFWVSVEIRLMVSPRVHCCRASLLITRPWGFREKISVLFTVVITYLCVNCMCYLPVDKTAHSCLQSHPHCEAMEHILMIEEWLQTWEQEEQRGKQKALPHRSIFVLHEAQQCTDNSKETTSSTTEEELTNTSINNLRTICITWAPVVQWTWRRHGKWGTVSHTGSKVQTSALEQVLGKCCGPNSCCLSSTGEFFLLFLQNH